MNQLVKSEKELWENLVAHGRVVLLHRHYSETVQYEVCDSDSGAMGHVRHCDYRCHFVVTRKGFAGLFTWTEFVLKATVDPLSTPMHPKSGYAPQIGLAQVSSLGKKEKIIEADYDVCVYLRWVLEEMYAKRIAYEHKQSEKRDAKKATKAECSAALAAEREYAQKFPGQKAYLKALGRKR